MSWLTKHWKNEKWRRRRSAVRRLEKLAKYWQCGVEYALEQHFSVLFIERSLECARAGTRQAVRARAGRSRWRAARGSTGSTGTMQPPAFPPAPAPRVRVAPGSDACLQLPLPSGTPPFIYEWYVLFAPSLSLPHHIRLLCFVFSDA